MIGTKELPGTTSTHETERYYLRARECIHHNNYQDAAEMLEFAVRTAPDNPRYLTALGICYAYGSERLAAAERLCRTAVSMDPQNPEFLCNLGRVLKLLDHRREAYEVFLRAYQVDPRNALAAAELARLGVRRKTVLPFLERSHPINRFLGKARHAMIRLRR